MSGTVHELEDSGFAVVTNKGDAEQGEDCIVLMDETSNREVSMDLNEALQIASIIIAFASEIIREQS